MNTTNNHPRLHLHLDEEIKYEPINYELPEGPRFAPVRYPNFTLTVMGFVMIILSPFCFLSGILCIIIGLLRGFVALFR